MPATCVVSADDLTTIALSRLRQQITVLSPEKMEAVSAAVRFALDL